MFGGAFTQSFAKAFGGAVSSIVYLLRDEFTTPEAAPLASPRTCEPGPGQFTILDTGNHASISSSKLNLVGVFAAFSNPAITSVSTYSRSSGLCFKYTVNVASQYVYAGYKSSVIIGNDLYFQSTALFIYDTSAIGLLLSPAITLGSEYQVSIVLRSAGALYFIKGGSQYSDWTLLYVGNLSNSSNLPFLIIPGIDINSAFDRVAITQLLSPYNTDTGFATYYDATPTSGDTATSEANSMQYIEWTPGAGETFELSVRRTDDDNRWIIRCSQSGSTIKLIERNAGVETEHGSAAQTWTVATKYRLKVHVYGTNILTYISFSALNNYASATFNQSVTGCKISGGATLEDWEIFPRVLSGTALATIEAI